MPVSFVGFYLTDAVALAVNRHEINDWGCVLELKMIAMLA